MPQGSVPSAAFRAGVASAVVAYVLWGLFPLYWGFLRPATPWEVLAARVIFALVALVLLVSLVGQWGEVGQVAAHRRRRWLLTLAAVVVSLNWGTFIWAVDNEHVVECSLGYFINPLVSVALGVIVLRERLRRLQWTAIGIATAAVLYSTLALGKVPLVALTLAFSFGCYGLLKKLAGVDAIASLTFEMLVLTPAALLYVAWLARADQLEFGANGPGHALLMVGAGPVTALPLLFFGFAAHRVPLSLLGPLQYLAPSIQLVIGIWWLGETLSPAGWVGFIGVWIALAVFTVDLVRNVGQSQPRPGGLPSGAAVTAGGPPP